MQAGSQSFILKSQEGSERQITSLKEKRLDLVTSQTPEATHMLSEKICLVAPEILESRDLMGKRSFFLCDLDGSQKLIEGKAEDKLFSVI